MPLEERTLVSLATATAQEVIAELGMQPHPEGGHFVETFRDRPLAGERGAITAIYFLLKSGEVSRWHRVDAVEIWRWYAGAPLKLSIAVLEGAPPKEYLLGSSVLAGVRPQAVVPAHAWQSARSLGDRTLVGCTVAPAFQYEGFELAPEGWEPDSEVGSQKPEVR
ncbi:MAG: cupin domain-containing protein [Dongiaceae bacterium]